MTELQTQQLNAAITHIASQGELTYKARTELIAFGTDESLSELIGIYNEGLSEAYPQYEIFVDMLDAPKIEYKDDDTVHDKELLIRVFNNKE